MPYFDSLFASIIDNIDDIINYFHQSVEWLTVHLSWAMCELSRVACNTYNQNDINQSPANYLATHPTQNISSPVSLKCGTPEEIGKDKR